MQDEDRRFRGNSINLLECRHAAFSELELAPTADYAHPLAGRRPLGLLLEHAQSVREGRHAVPSKLQVIAEAAADNMHVGIVQPWNDAAAFEVNHLGVRSAFVFLGL